MKILQITSLYSPHVGGIEKHVFELSSRLIKEGHEVVVYTSNIPKSPKYEVSNGVHIYRFSAVCSPLNNQIIPGLLLKFAEENKFDIIHIHSHVHFSSIAAVMCNLWNKCPIVLTSHGVPDYKGWKKIIEFCYNKTFGKIILCRADKIVCLSEKHANILQKIGANSRKIEIIPDWVDLNVKYSDKKGLRFKDYYGIGAKKIILFVGGLIKRKGIDCLISSMRYVKMDCVLLIVGDEITGHSNVKKELEKQIEELGLNNIIFLGRLSDEDLQSAYSAADLFVLPSISEVFGLVILEAMCYKICVIASNVLGPSTIIDNYSTGVLFTPGDYLELADKINYLLDNPNITKGIAGNSRSMVEQKYNIDNIVPKLINLYSDLALLNK